MTDAEQREAARQFYQKWAGKGKEDQDDRSYWLDILIRILGVDNATDHIEFQKKVIVDGNTKRIDAYLPETRVIIEQKSLGIQLDHKVKQSGGIDLTPYEQAKRYNDNLPYDERARWIVTSNFAEIWVYDMNERVPESNVQVIKIENLQTEVYRLSFLIKEKDVVISEEMQVSIDAGKIVGLLYDAFYKQYGIDNLADDNDRRRALESLNILCVRIVFCLYAEDAGLFSAHGAFHDYMSRYETRDMRRALIDLFQVLNTPDGTAGSTNKRDRFMEEELARFPYVNGELFFGNYEVPPFTDEIRDLILRKASEDFDWSKISPTIFGAVFESTLNPETRRSGGMHYTSIENIHKVIDPLFLDDLKTELEEIKAISVTKTLKDRLHAYQDKLGSLTFLDPACGSGNFLTETYLSLRRLENKVLELQIEADRKEVSGQITFADATHSPVKVSIHQFYGIEINDFAVTVAKTALWISEYQMLKETETIVHQNIPFLPLKSYANIAEGNALRMDWEEVVPKEQLNFIMGNPPFVGGMMMSADQKSDIRSLYKTVKLSGEMDYVTGWYKKAIMFIANTNIRTAFVSTNSICQGQQAASVWKEILSGGVIIYFAHRTFRWDSEASDKARVHCVIIGLTYDNQVRRTIYDNDGSKSSASNINPYLQDAPTIYIQSQSKPICDVPPMKFGSMPRDGGNLIVSEKEYLYLKETEPDILPMIREYLGAEEFLHNKKRYCLWLNHADPSQISRSPFIRERIELVRQFRENSKAAATRKFAETPTLFCQIAQPESGSYIAVPETSSEKRRYIPMGFLSCDIIASNLLFLIPDATLYHFGILESNVHMAWMRCVSGRLKSDYRYSKDIVYNCFVWPETTQEQEKRIENTAKSILDVRARYSKSALSDLYHPNFMPKDLLLAHRENDRAVMQAYGFSVRDMSEEATVAALMELYQKKVASLKSR